MRIRVLHHEKLGAVGSIEYPPGEYAWRAVRAPGYLVIHCLFILKKDFKGKGYGAQLLRACEKDARTGNRHGVAAVTSRSTWMAKDSLFLKNR
jgi:GNAT superfamily N-acetyltransferase